MTAKCAPTANSAHTPGPWHVSHRGSFDCDIAGPNGEDLAFVNSSDGADEPTEYPLEANARLIAEAPTLLASLTEAMRLIDCYGLVMRDVNADIWRAAARDTIAKATGAAP